MLVFHAPTPWDLSEQEDLALHSFLPSPHVWQALAELVTFHAKACVLPQPDQNTIYTGSNIDR
jgi:hypothetical protein